MSYTRSKKFCACVFSTSSVTDHQTYFVRCVTYISNLRKIGRKLWSLSRAIGTLNRKTDRQTDRQTNIQVILYLSNAMNCIGQTISASVLFKCKFLKSITSALWLLQLNQCCQQDIWRQWQIGLLRVVHCLSLWRWRTTMSSSCGDGQVQKVSQTTHDARHWVLCAVDHWSSSHHCTTDITTFTTDWQLHQHVLWYYLCVCTHDARHWVRCVVDHWSSSHHCTTDITTFTTDIEHSRNAYGICPRSVVCGYDQIYINNSQEC